MTLIGPEPLTDHLKSALLSQWRGNSPQNLLTHGFHPRLAAMNPLCCHHLLQTIPKGVVNDPFCGTGAVVIEAMRGGREAVGSDVSSLAVGICRAQTWLATQSELVEFREKVATVVERLKRLGDDVDWDKAARITTGVITNGGAEPQSLPVATALVATAPVATALHFVLSFIQHDKFEDWRRFRPLSYRYERTAQRYAEKIQELRNATPEGTARPCIAVGDAKVSRGRKLAGVVTSPPYPGVYNYVAVDNEGASTLADFVGKGVEAAEIGTAASMSEMSLEKFQDSFQEDTVAWLRAQCKDLEVGGRIAMLIGDSNQGGICAAESIARGCESVAGLKVVARASMGADVRRPWGKQKRNYRIEHCILLEKSEEEERQVEERQAEERLPMMQMECDPLPEPMRYVENIVEVCGGFTQGSAGLDVPAIQTLLDGCAAVQAMPLIQAGARLNAVSYTEATQVVAGVNTVYVVKVEFADWQYGQVTLRQFRNLKGESGEATLEGWQLL